MITFADVFCGCGGLSHGLYRHEKFKGILAVDSWPVAGKVFSLNHPDMPFELRDLFDSEDLRGIEDRLRGKCDVLLGGPPCQGFSTLGKRRDNDRRSCLVETFLNLCVHIRPKILVMENVRGITSKIHQSGMTFSEFVNDTLTNGHGSSTYNTKDILINALDYGLAQTRTRWFLLGVRKDIDEDGRILDRIATTIERHKSRNRLVLRDVIGDLPHVESGEGADEMFVESNGTKKTIHNHRAMNHTPHLIRRLSHVPPGGGLRDVPYELLTEHLRKMLAGSYGDGGHIKNIYGRMEWDKPSGTIVAGIDKITCGRFVHPSANRLLTPRECARIQSFPDEFRFCGSNVAQYYLIGNAVPPRVSLILADAIALEMTSCELRHEHAILKDNHI